jgi:hypothetical protein
MDQSVSQPVLAAYNALTTNVLNSNMRQQVTCLYGFGIACAHLNWNSAKNKAVQKVNSLASLGQLTDRNWSSRQRSMNKENGSVQLSEEMLLACL